MSWFITGDRKGLALAVSDSGVPTCHGQALHDPRPPGLNDYGGNIDDQLLRRLKRSECAWSLALTGESDGHIDPVGDGLLERVRSAPDQPHGMIKFYSGTPDFVGFSMVVPERTFGHIWRLFELVLRSDSLGYSFTIDFLGFRVPHAQVEIPTWEEFMNGRPYFFDELSVAVSARDSDA